MGGEENELFVVLLGGVTVQVVVVIDAHTVMHRLIHPTGPNGILQTQIGYMVVMGGVEHGHLVLGEEALFRFNAITIQELFPFLSVVT